MLPRPSDAADMTKSAISDQRRLLRGATGVCSRKLQEVEPSPATKVQPVEDRRTG